MGWADDWQRLSIHWPCGQTSPTDNRIHSMANNGSVMGRAAITNGT